MWEVNVDSSGTGIVWDDKRKRVVATFPKEFKPDWDKIVCQANKCFNAVIALDNAKQGELQL